MVNEERLVKRFMEYVRIDSESKNEKAFGEHLAAELRALGMEVHLGPVLTEEGSNFGNIVAKLPGNVPGTPVAFSCHMDTVTPGIGIKPVVRDGMIYSDGTTILGADDKAGIAEVMEALTELTEEEIQHGPVEVVFSVMEEKGLRGATNLDSADLEARHVYVLDGGTVGGLTMESPYQEKLDITVFGKAAHAGVEPEKGISALYVAAKAIARMKLFPIDEETTANIGTIEGGRATNIVMPEVKMQAEARSLNPQKIERQMRHMIELFEEEAAEAGAKLELVRRPSYPGYKLDPKDEIVVKAQRAYEKAGIPVIFEKSGGGSDTNVFWLKGIKALTLGTGEEKAHTLEESVNIAEMVKSVRAIRGIVQEYIH